MKNILIIIVSIILMLAGISCMAVSELVTPAEINKSAVKYAVNSGVADEQDYLGYPNLGKARRLVVAVDSAHKVNVFDLQQRLAKDSLDYTMLRGVVTNNEQIAVEREQMLFGQSGLLSMGLSMLGVGGLGGVIGLLRRKPGDWSPEEVTDAITEATGKTSNELSAKNKQVIQLVQSVDALIKTFNLDKTKIKSVLNGVQDGDVQIAVSTTKRDLGI